MYSLSSVIKTNARNSSCDMRAIAFCFFWSRNVASRFRAAQRTGTSVESVAFPVAVTSFFSPASKKPIAVIAFGKPLTYRYTSVPFIRLATLITHSSSHAKIVPGCRLTKRYISSLVHEWRHAFPTRQGRALSVNSIIDDSKPRCFLLCFIARSQIQRGAPDFLAGCAPSLGT